MVLLILMLMLSLLVWGVYFENQLSKKKAPVFQQPGFDYNVH